MNKTHTDPKRAMTEFILEALQPDVGEMVANALNTGLNPMLYVSRTIDLLFRSTIEGEPATDLADMQLYEDGSNGFVSIGKAVLKEANKYLSLADRTHIVSMLSMVINVLQPSE